MDVGPDAYGELTWVRHLDGQPSIELAQVLRVISGTCASWVWSLKHLEGILDAQVMREDIRAMNLGDGSPRAPLDLPWGELCRLADTSMVNEVRLAARGGRDAFVEIELFDGWIWMERSNHRTVCELLAGEFRRAIELGEEELGP